MPHLNIITSIRRLTQKQLLPRVSRKWRHQFRFGMNAYALRAFQSATGNARMVVANPNTAPLRVANQLTSIGGYSNMRE